jgi:raffinose/stachyose/melibiose transport system permease protein
MKDGKVSRFFVHLLLAFCALISVYPLVWLFFYSFKNNEEIFVTNPFGIPLEWRFENYAKAIKQLNLMVYFKNSVVVAVVTIILVILFSSMFCYIVARIRNRPTKFLHAFVMAGMFIPIQAVMIPLVITVRQLGITNSLWSVIIPYTALGFPFACMLLYGFYLSIPFELEESAYLDGASFGRTYFVIIFPLLKSVTFVLAIYEFMSCWNEFSLALVLLTKNIMKTLPLGLAGFFGDYSAEWGAIGAALVIASAPVLFIYLFFSNQIVDSMAVSGMKN